MRQFFLFLFKFLIILTGLLVLGYIVLSMIVRPSLNRDWTPDQAILPQVKFGGNIVTINNIRNNEYRTVSDYDVHYYNKTFDLNKLESVWYMVEPFSGHGLGAAHTLVSFGFEGGDYVAISAEIRKEKGEAFSPLKGLLRQYELVYIIADERDVIKLRSNYRKDDVFLYPVKTNKENMQKLFVSMLERSNQLATKSEFYNTITNSCTTNIVSHVNELAPGKIPWSYKILMPAYSDDLARKVGLLDRGLSLKELREKYQINDRATEYANDPLFSQRIRGL